MSRLSFLLTENWNHGCPVCELSFSSKDILSLHFAQHSMMEKYTTSLDLVIPVPVPVNMMPSPDYYTVNGMICSGRNYPDITRGFRRHKNLVFYCICRFYVYFISTFVACQGYSTNFYTIFNYLEVFKREFLASNKISQRKWQSVIILLIRWWFLCLIRS